MKKLIKDIIFRKDLYPRFEEDQKKIQEYSENIERLPPIIINQDNILIDGWHRIKAHKTAQLKEIECNVEKTISENELYLRAIELNATHGLQLNYEDKKKIARKLFDVKKPDINKRISNALSVTVDTFNKWVSDIRNDTRYDEEQAIIREYLKAEKSQQDIEKMFEQSSGKISKLSKEICLKINLFFGKDLSKIDEKHEDFAFINNNKNLLNFKPFLYNIWNISNITNNTPHFGNFPQEFMENLLYYYTEPFSVVYDPFAGGGVTIDACNKWFRRYYVSDAFPIPAREEDIKKWKIQDGLPDDLPKIDFVFLDPPYWKQAEGKYSNDINDLSNMSLSNFYATLVTLVKEVKKKLTNDGKIAFVISGTAIKSTDYKREDHACQICQIFEKLDFKINERIILPYSTEQYNGTQVNIFKDKKRMMNLYRDLIIFEKRVNNENS